MLLLHWGAATALNFPVSGTALREGDILLAYSPTALSAAIARFSKPQGSYSHTALFHISPVDGPRIIEMGSKGLESVEPAKFLSQYQRIALLRLKRRVDETSLSQSAEWLIAESRAGRVSFDFKMDWHPETDGQYLCNEMTSIVYRRAGLPDPFPIHETQSENLWIDWVKKNTDMNLDRIVSPNALLQQPEFRLIAEIERDGDWQEREIVLNAALDRMRLYIERMGYEPVGPGPGSRMLISLGQSGLFEDKLAALLSRLDVDIYYFIIEYIDRIYARVQTVRRKNGDPTWSAERLRELTESVCDAYRERFFRKRRP